jgi:hypothetical protein
MGTLRGYLNKFSYRKKSTGNLQENICFQNKSNAPKVYTNIKREKNFV